MAIKILLLLILLPLKSLYVPLNRRKAKHYWKLPIDDKIPLIPIFIIPYLLHQVGLVLTGIALWNTSYIEPFLLSLIISYVIAVSFWYLIPNGVKRPPSIHKSFFTPYINMLYQVDGDSNGFPSAHIIVTLLCGHFLSLAFGVFIPYIWIGVSSVVLSVLFTKQHYIIDIPGGAFVYAISYYLSRVILG